MYLKVKKYSAFTDTGLSFVEIIRELKSQVSGNIWQISVQFKRDFKNSYQGTALGKLWAVITPLIPLSVYLLLGLLRAVNVDGEIGFVPYIIVGATAWYFITGTIRAIINAPVKNSVILNKMNYPMSAVLVSHFGSTVFDLLVRLVLAVAVCIIYGVYFGISLFYLPIIILFIILFSFGSGMILSIINIAYKDAAKIADIVFSYGLFVSSVIFPMPEEGIIGMVNNFNPFNTFITEFRSVLILGEINSPLVLGITSLLSLVIFLYGCKFLFVMEKRVRHII